MSQLPRSLHIAVIRGGSGSEYQNSLDTGGSILKHLFETHRPLDIFISKNGTWHMHGKPQKPERIFPHIDVAFNTLHGKYNKDHMVQNFFTHHGVRYTGSDMLSSAISTNRILSKDLFLKNGLKTPSYVAVRRSDDISQKSREIFQNFVMPVIIKPANIGKVSLFKIADTAGDILDAIREAFKHSPSVLVEEYISGTDVACVVSDDFRGQPVYAFMPMETGSHNPAHPAQESDIKVSNLKEKDKKMVEEYARVAHKSLGLRQYSSSHFVVSPKRGVYILETNPSPRLAGDGVFPESLKAVGVSEKDFIYHILSLALNSKI